MSARSFMRVPVHVVAWIRPDSGGEIQGVVRDLSLNGAAVECPGGAPALGPCVVHFVLQAGAEPIRVAAAGSVLRVEGALAAVRFTSVDADDEDHFTNLVLYNAPDAAAFEEEALRQTDLRPRLEPLKR
ncbi:MAG: PilZ domain-containing protein [Gemmatimonadetes bacterium]|nr:PilZ domain-containing protein [Gemmatimonadota bacterium]